MPQRYTSGASTLDEVLFHIQDTSFFSMCVEIQSVFLSPADKAIVRLK